MYNWNTNVYNGNPMHQASSSSSVTSSTNYPNDTSNSSSNSSNSTHSNQYFANNYDPFDPVNRMSMDEQERKKLDRKRERNRQAASKCRQKKMDRIKELEDQVAYESQKSARLDTELEQLQNVLNSFQSIVQRHSNGGCPNSMNKV